MLDNSINEVDCIHDGGNNPDGGAHTNSLVKQTYTVLPRLQDQVTAVVTSATSSLEILGNIVNLIVNLSSKHTHWVTHHHVYKFICRFLDLFAFQL